MVEGEMNEDERKKNRVKKKGKKECGVGGVRVRDVETLKP
jgi:hypothetical protein